MQVGRSAAWVAALAAAGLLSLGPVCGGGGIAIEVPLAGQLSLAGDVAARISLPGDADLDTLAIELDGHDLTALLPVGGGVAEGTLPGVAVGAHDLHASVSTPSGVVSATRQFETAELASPEACESLNQAHCLLPYPSDFFRRDAGMGPELVIPQEGLPIQGASVIDPAIFRVRDGFSPTAQILVSFPAGVDLETSGAARLLAEPNRFTDGTSLSPQSPSLLLDEAGGARILHWLENDARASEFASQVLFMRPGRSLTPGKRYLVAFRHLVDWNGQPIEPEPVFAALRDGRPTDIPAVEARRADFERIFARLAQAGFARASLQLAFEFTVASDENLTGQMLSMRDQALAWLAGQNQDSAQSFTVESQVTHDCAAPGQRVWREVRGRFSVPLFLSLDPETMPVPPSFLVVGPDGFTPEWSALTQPRYGISIPCAALEDPATTRVHPIVIGHGLFGNGPETAIGIGGRLGDEAFGVDAAHAITGGASWRGLSSQDIGSPITQPSFIVTSVVTQLKNISALPDRLRQGVLNQLVLARMMKTGAFNAHPAFQAPAGHGVFRPGEESYYFGISLGGIMGLMFSAVNQDVIKHNVDVPAINFVFLLQRATPFLPFQFILDLSIGNDDPVTQPMVQAIGLSLIHELWVTGEPAGYATHITKDPLPGTPRKQILLTMAWLDQQVSNQGSEIAARTLNLSQL
jgi:hypothetical protein